MEFQSGEDDPVEADKHDSRSPVSNAENMIATPNPPKRFTIERVKTKEQMLIYKNNVRFQVSDLQTKEDCIPSSNSGNTISQDVEANKFKTCLLNNKIFFFFRKFGDTKTYRSLQNCFLVSSNQKLFTKLMKNQIGGYEAERSRHLKSFPETIHPFSEFRWGWDIFMTIVLIITLISQPLQITFYSASLSRFPSSLLNSAACFIFMLDIILNFRTGFIGKESDDVVLDSRLTARHYAKTWFVVDFLSTIPFDLLYIAIADIDSDSRYYFKYFRLLDLLKILRLARVIRYLTKIQQAYGIKPLYGRVINLVVMMSFVTHWLSCMHYLVADLLYGKHFEGDTYDEDNLSWVTEMKIWYRPVWEKYLHCVLRALSNMGCLGYGYAAPRAPEDVLATIVSILIGATWFALFIANVSNIVLNLDSSQKKYDETLSHIMDYMKFNHMPKELKDRVESYFEQRYRHNLFNEDEILENLSSVLKTQLKMFNCHRLVQQVPMFRGIRTEILQEVVACLKSEVYLPRDVIVWENAVGECMYFIHRGTVSVLSTSGKMVTHLCEGNFFGEMALITNDRRRVATVVAVTRCDVYALHKKDFEHVVKMYPEVFRDILQVAQERARKITIEQTDNILSSDETIKSGKRPLRKSLQDTFTRSKNCTSMNDRLVKSSSADSILSKPTNGKRPHRTSLEEIMNLKLDNLNNIDEQSSYEMNENHLFDNDSIENQNDHQQMQRQRKSGIRPIRTSLEEIINYDISQIRPQN